MKKIIGFLFIAILITSAIVAQQTKPALLKQPADWEFERFSLPPAFAPEITYKGIEELRFAPGMFKKDSVDYFTYIFIAAIDSVVDISANDIQIYLMHYFKGLCEQTAKDKQLTINPSKISATFEKNEMPSRREIIYNYSLDVFGVFTDGAPVKLNMEVKLIKDAPHKKIYLLFTTSPQPKTSKVWKKLFEIQRDFKIPSN